VPAGFQRKVSELESLPPSQSFPDARTPYLIFRSIGMVSPELISELGMVSPELGHRDGPRRCEPGDAFDRPGDDRGQPTDTTTALAAPTGYRHVGALGNHQGQG